MKKVGKGSIGVITVLAIIIIIIITIIIMNLNKPKEQEIQIENGISKETVQLKDIEFSEITSSYVDGITTIRAKMHNNSNTSKNLNVQIILKDEEGNQIGEMRQNIENVEVGKEKVFVTGITGDYSNVKDIEMKVIE